MKLFSFLIMLILSCFYPQAIQASEDISLADECSAEKKMKTLIRKGIMTKELCLEVLEKDRTDDTNTARILDKAGIKLVITGNLYELGEHYNGAKYNYKCPPKEVKSLTSTTPTATPTPEALDTKFGNFPIFLKKLQERLKTETGSDTIAGQVKGYADGVRYIGTAFDNLVEAEIIKSGNAAHKTSFDKYHCEIVDGANPPYTDMLNITQYRNRYLALSRAETLQTALKKALSSKGAVITFKEAIGFSSGTPIDQDGISYDNVSIETGKPSVGCCDNRRGALASFEIPTIADSVKVKPIYLTPVFNAVEEAVTKKMLKTAAKTFISDFKSFINNSTDSDLKTLIGAATTKTHILTDDMLKEAGWSSPKLATGTYTIIDHSTTLTTELIYTKTYAQVNSFISSKWGVTPSKNYEKTMANYMTYLFWACFKGTCSFTPDQFDLHAFYADGKLTDKYTLSSVSYLDLYKAVIAEQPEASYNLGIKTIKLKDYLLTKAKFEEANPGIDYYKNSAIVNFVALVSPPSNLKSFGYDKTLKMVFPATNIDIKKGISEYRTSVITKAKVSNTSAFSKLSEATATKLADYLVSMFLRKIDPENGATQSATAYDVEIHTTKGKAYLIEPVTTTNKLYLAKAIKEKDPRAPYIGFDNSSIPGYVVPTASASSAVVYAKQYPAIDGTLAGTEIFSYFDLREAYAEMLVDANKTTPLYRYMAQSVPTKHITGIKMETKTLEELSGNYSGKGYFHTACGTGTKYNSTDKKFNYKSWWQPITELDYTHYYTLPKTSSPFNMIQLKRLHAYLIDSCQDCSCLWGKTADEIVSKLNSATKYDFSGWTTKYTGVGTSKEGELIVGTDKTYNTTMCLFSPIVPLGHYIGEGGQTFTPKTVIPPSASCGIIEVAKLAVPDSKDVVTNTTEIDEIYKACNGTTTFAKTFPWSRKKCDAAGAKTKSCN